MQPRNLHVSIRIAVHTVRNTVGTVIATAPAFRLADFTADRDSHPALKICGRKDKGFSHIFVPLCCYILKILFCLMGFKWRNAGKFGKIQRHESRV